MIVTLCTPAAAVVATVSVTVAVVPGEIDAGLMLAVTPAGVFAVSVTAFFAVPLSVTPTVNVTVLPASAEPEVADCVIAKLMPELVAPPPHTRTSTAPSTDPSPVARLYSPPLAVNPVTPGTLLFPEGVA